MIPFHHLTYVNRLFSFYILQLVTDTGRLNKRVAECRASISLTHADTATIYLYWFVLSGVILFLFLREEE